MINQPVVDNVIASVQRQLISNHVSDISNVQAIKSETVIKDILKSYSDKFANLGEQLTSLTKLSIDERSLISKDQFNNILLNLYIDVKSLYSQLDIIDEQLDLNLTRNKNFFSILKRRTQDLNNQLHQIQVNIDDSSIYDETYFESFSNSIGSHKYIDVDVDKKSGLLKLNPVKTEFQNKSFLIKDIKSTIIPFITDDGGVIDSTSEYNTFEYNYSKKELKDMLVDGLWKHQLFCNDIPIIKYNINPDTDGSPMYIQTTGIVAIVDIVFTRTVDINTLDVDLFGEFKTDLLSVLYLNEYKDHDNISKLRWVPIRSNSRPEYTPEQNAALGVTSNFDYIQINNIKNIQTSSIRLVFNQKNFTTSVGNNSDLENISSKINNDMSQKRLIPIETKIEFDDGPGVDDSFELKSLKIKVYDIIESTYSIQQTLNEIILLFDPMPQLSLVDVSKLLKYELGAWSILPSFNTYIGSGTFISSEYTIRDKSLLAVSLITKQTEPVLSTVNWEILSPDESKSFPLLERDKKYRIEPVKVINNAYMTQLGYTTGSIIKLDFPINILSLAGIDMYINGVKKNLNEYLVAGKIFFFNSRTFFIDGITDINKYTYLIRYIPSFHDTCYIYTISILSNTGYPNLEKYIAFTTKELAITFLTALDKNNIEKYIINKDTITVHEWNSLFNNKSISILSSINTGAILACINKYFKDTVNIYSGSRLIQYGTTEYNDIKLTYNLSGIYAYKPSVYFN